MLSVTAWPGAPASLSPILFEATREGIAALGSLDKALVDPPREGAIELVKALPDDGYRA